jgi:hypothetical protein
MGHKWVKHPEKTQQKDNRYCPVCGAEKIYNISGSGRLDHYEKRGIFLVKSPNCLIKPLKHI